MFTRKHFVGKITTVFHSRRDHAVSDATDISSPEHTEQSELVNTASYEGERSVLADDKEERGHSRRSDN